MRRKQTEPQSESKQADRVRSTIVRLLRTILALTVFILLPARLLSGDALAAAECAEAGNITARADFLYGITWTAQTGLTGWKGLCTYRAGGIYHIPYAQAAANRGVLYWQVPVDRFLAAAEDADSEFYRLKARYQSPYYGMDCSAFVSYCWDAPARTSTVNWETLDADCLGLCTAENAERLEAGDALNLVSGDNSHVVLVTRIFPDGVYEITEQTYPEMQRIRYTAAQLTANYDQYSVYRLRDRESVSPPPDRRTAVDPEGIGKRFPALLVSDGWRLLTAEGDSANCTETDTENPGERMIWRIERQEDGSAAVLLDSDRRVLTVSENGYILSDLAEGETPPADWRVSRTPDGTWHITPKAGGESYCIRQYGKYAPLDDPSVLACRQPGACFQATLTEVTGGKLLAAQEASVLLSDPPEAAAVWQFEACGNGTYVIRSCASGRVLDGAAGASGNRVTLTELYGGDCQKWFLIAAGEDCFQLRRYHQTAVLDAQEAGLCLTEPDAVSRSVFRLHILTEEGAGTEPAVGTEPAGTERAGQGTQGIPGPAAGERPPAGLFILAAALLPAAIRIRNAESWYRLRR